MSIVGMLVALFNRRIAYSGIVLKIVSL